LANATFSKVFDIVVPYIEEHERTLDHNNIRDFLDLMLLEHKNSSDSSSCFNGKLGKATIVNSIIDLFFTGMETTTTLLMNIILHLLHHMDVQEKVHQEIDQVGIFSGEIYYKSILKVKFYLCHMVFTQRLFVKFTY
jgi:cytochrome P450